MSQAPPTESAPGSPLRPAFRRTTGLGTWNRFAAVNDEFIPIHMDDEAGTAAGFPGAIGMGNLQWTYLHCALREWFPGARISSVRCRFVGPNLRGQTVEVHGGVTGLVTDGDDDVITVDLAVMADGDTVLSTGSATVRVARTTDAA